MGSKGIVSIVVVIIIGYFLYEPVVDRFFTDTRLRVPEAAVPSSPGGEEDLELVSDGIAFRFSPIGARIISARLRHYSNGDGAGEELIADLLKTRSGLRVELPDGTSVFEDDLYSYERDGAGLVFFRELPTGMEIRKFYEPHRQYGLNVRLRFTNRSRRAIAFPQGYRVIPFYGIHTSQGSWMKKTEVVWKGGPDGSVARHRSKKVKEDVIPEEPVAWAGLRNRYFAQVLVPLSREHTVAFHPLGHWQVFPTFVSPPFDLAPGQAYEAAYLLYLGPLIPKELTAYETGLEELIDYGTFAFLGKAVLALVRWIHGALGSYGLALIFLALLLRLLLFPVTQFNLKSLREMPRLLQQMDAIEDEEKEDPERAAARMQPLRKRQVQAMIGSFAPLVIQIPVFLALYQVLNTSIALRNAGFGPWITDLSMRDPLFLLPLLMGAAMIVQQRLTVANPKQNRTWIWMPAGFALLFSFFPAGLVLFWLADSVLSAAQLAWIAYREPGR